MKSFFLNFMGYELLFQSFIHQYLTFNVFLLTKFKLNVIEWNISHTTFIFQNFIHNEGQFLGELILDFMDFNEVFIFRRLICHSKKHFLSLHVPFVALENRENK